MFFNDFFDFCNGFIVFQNVYLLHIPTGFKEVGQFQWKQVLILRVPQFKEPVFRYGQYCWNLHF